MASILDDEAGVKTQFILWHYAITGDICERSAVIAEGKNVETIVPDAWDHGVEWLAGKMVAYGDEPYQRAPEHWCLPAVTELRLRREEDFWELVKRA